MNIDEPDSFKHLSDVSLYLSGVLALFPTITEQACKYELKEMKRTLQQEYEIRAAGLQAKEQEWEKKSFTLQQKEQYYNYFKSYLTNIAQDYEDKVAKLHNNEQEYEQRVAALKAKETDCGSRETKLHENEREYEIRVSELKENEQQYNDRVSKLQANEQEYEQRVAALKERETDCGGRETKLHENEREYEIGVSELKENEQQHNDRVSKLQANEENEQRTAKSAEFDGCPHPSVQEWLPGKSFKLVYKATRDGFGARDFHRLCDDIGATITLIHTPEGYFFGGYVHGPWKQEFPATFHHDFIFTIINPNNIPPTKYIHTSPLVNMISFASGGPILGYNDVFVASDSNVNRHSYTTYNNFVNTTNKVDYHFTTSEIEVYSVI